MQRSFDKTVSTQGVVWMPEKYDELFRLPASQKIIARGAGLSYSAAAGDDEAVSVDMRLFNRILSFDANNGFIKVEAGMSIGALNNFLVQKGWTLSVLPGYPAITVGGCIGFNVHGKSQYKTGTFKNWVSEITLFHPAKGMVVCNETENNNLLQLTVGAMGLTGIIISATLKLKKIEGNLLDISAHKVANIYEAVKLMNDEAENHDYIYAWNNFNLKGNSFGRGIVYLENHLAQSKNVKIVPYKNKLTRFQNSPVLYNSLTIPAMNFVYELMDAVKPRKRTADLINSTFPIYGKEIYYYFFGHKGFREYQVIFDLAKWENAVEEIKSLIKKMRMPIALGSLKIFKGSPHFISFSGSGLCVTIDVANNEKSVSFFNALDEISIKYNGIINLSKDSRASAELVKNCFADYNLFKQQLNEFDTEKVFTSELRKRLEL